MEEEGPRLEEAGPRVEEASFSPAAARGAPLLRVFTLKGRRGPLSSLRGAELSV